VHPGGGPQPPLNPDAALPGRTPAQGLADPGIDPPAALDTDALRVAMIGFRPGPGGVGRDMTNLMRGLAASGLTLDLLVPPGSYPELDITVETDTAPRTVPLGPPGCLARAFVVADAECPRAQAQLQRYVARYRPAVILSNKQRTNRLLLEALSAPGRPRLLFRLGSDLRERIRRRSLLRRHSYRAELQQTLTQADGLLTISAGVADSARALLEHAAPTLHPVHVPVDLARIAALAAAKPAHPWLGDGGAPVILSVGRLVAAKDYPTLLRAFARLRQQQPVRLLIFGEGNRRRPLMRLLRRLGLGDCAQLPGHLDNPFAAMARAALFVVSSRFEGLSNVLIEALACGTPCVATDCRSGPREILEDGTLGPLVPVGDHRRLARAMAATLDDPLPPERLRQGAEPYAIAASVAEHLAAFGVRQPGGR
jgi:glycosyltransferase involved in cell wall biosynthesis